MRSSWPFGMPGPRVGDRDADVALDALGVDRHRGAAAVLDRVVDQVLHDVIEALARAEHREIGGHLGIDLRRSA